VYSLGWAGAARRFKIIPFGSSSYVAAPDFTAKSPPNHRQCIYVLTGTCDDAIVCCDPDQVRKARKQRNKPLPGFLEDDREFDSYF